MKKKLFLLLVVCLICIGRVTASNVLTIGDVFVPIGGQATIEIGCDFDTEFTAFELQLSLPVGLTLMTDEGGNPIVERGFEGSHIVEGNLLSSNGNYKFVCYSMEKASLPMTGILMRVTVKADEFLQPGTVLSVRIISQEFVRTIDSNGESLADKDVPVPICEIQASQRDDATVYDLGGRQVVNGRQLKGVFIIGGKKILK